MFSSKHSKKRLAINNAVGGLLFREDIQCKYNINESIISTSTYVLPVDYINNYAFGFFLIDEHWMEARIGFRQVKQFINSIYYHIDEHCRLIITAKPNDNVLYLPLTVTKFTTQLFKKNEKGTLVLDEKSPFPVFGIQGTKAKHPLLLVSQTEEGVMCKGLYAEKGYARIFQPNTADIKEKLEELLKNTLNNKPVQKKIVQSNKIKSDKADSSEIDWSQPKKIVEYLDQYVINQDEAKKAVAVAFSNYMMQIKTGSNELPKDHILLIGPSGVGKTKIIDVLAKKAGIQFAQGKCSGKSAEGYVGDRLSLVLKQIKISDDNTAPYCIVFYDEIDKIAQGEHDYFGPLLQDELIGWTEETVLFGEDKKQQLNTKNLLFVFAGAFQGKHSYSLEDIIKERLGIKQEQIGFASNNSNTPVKNPADNILFNIRPEDLTNYGLKPELVGRLSCIGILNELSTEDKIRILHDTKDSALKKQKKLLELKGYTVEIEPEVLRIIAEMCPKETGARALSSICNNLFTKILYEPDMFAKEKLIRITPELAQNLITIYK